MIDCLKILEQIEQYLDRELEVPRIEEIERHLEGCGECLERAEFRRSLRLLIARKCRCEELPARLQERVLLRLRQERARSG